MTLRRPAEPDLSPLEHRLGHCFADRLLLRQALSHRSFAAERVGGAAPLCDQNEQLEHLGDSVLGFIADNSVKTIFVDGGYRQRMLDLGAQDSGPFLGH